jgi:hypothetical protein
MNNIFKGKRPYLGQQFIKDGVTYKVASIAPGGIVIGLRDGIESAQSHNDLTTIIEEFS